VIDGDRIAEDLPEVVNVYERVTRLVEELSRDEIERLADLKAAACNINITQPGGLVSLSLRSKRRDCDLYLNATPGGETECCPNYRVSLAPATHSHLQGSNSPTPSEFKFPAPVSRGCSRRCEFLCKASGWRGAKSDQ